MKTKRKLLQLCLLAALLPVGMAHTQSVTPVYAFTKGPAPMAALTLGPDGNFYGTTIGGGSSGGYGTVFQMTTNGILTTIYSFNYWGDGANPAATLTLGPDGNFYGTTQNGGNDYEAAFDYGTVFQVTPTGTLTTLYRFTGGNDGGVPEAALTLGPDGNFYGTTDQGGSFSYGTVFKITTTGTLTTLGSFSAYTEQFPNAALTLGPDGNFYGATAGGGSGGSGSVYQVTTNGTWTTLYSFPYDPNYGVLGNPDGALPGAALTLGPDGNFYGTTSSGGSGSGGTVFRVTTNGTLTTLYSFTDGNDGGNPDAALTLGPDGNFYGTTSNDGSGGGGTVFQITTNGTLTTLYSFAFDYNGTGIGVGPSFSLTLGPDGNFYGMTERGGSGGGGDVYRLSLPAAPVAGFAGTPTSGYAPLPVVFTDSSSGSFTTEVWSFGDGTFITNRTGASANENHIYTAAGSYTVSLTVTGPGGVSTAAQNSYVAVSTLPAAPVAGFVGTPTSGHAPLPVVFTDSSSGSFTNEVWSFGDRSFVTNRAGASANENHTYTAAGRYTVTLTVAGLGGASTYAQTNYVTVTNAPAVAGFTGGPTNGYGPLMVIFTNISTGTFTNSLWSFGDKQYVTNSTGGAVTHTFAAAGKYTVSLEVIGPSGSSTNTKPSYVTVLGPVAGFTGGPTNGYGPLTVAFTNTSLGTFTNSLWSFGDKQYATNSTGGAVTHTFAAAGKYTVSLKVSGPSGSSTNTKPSYVVVSGPVAGFTGTPTNGYGPLTVIFTNTSLGTFTNSLWSFGDKQYATNSTGGAVTHTFAAAGKYTVSLEVTGPSGSSTNTKPSYLTVLGPVAGFTGGPTNGYGPLTVIFTNTSLGTFTNSLWSFGDKQYVTNSTSGAVTHTFAAAGKYTVSLKVSGPEGTSTNSKAGYIVVLPAPRLAHSKLSAGRMGIGGTNGLAGQSYRILWSTNLVDWFPVYTNAFLEDGSYSCTNLMATNHLGFFRLIAP